MNFEHKLIEALNNANRVAILTGAGISAESGIKTFRDPDGLWAKLNPAELASIDGFMQNPETVWNWYNERRKVIQGTKPNAGHFALVELEEKYDSFHIVTQNIDRLHQMAGSKNVIELHGNIIENHCFDCKEPYLKEINLDDKELPKCPKCGGKIRPSVVWFGESLPFEALKQAEKVSLEADVFFSIGTSSEVYPAAALPYFAKNAGAIIVEVNPNETKLSSAADFVLRGTSATVLPELVKLLK